MVQIVVHTFRLNVPVQVYQSVPELHHLNHRRRQVRVQIPGLAQDSKEVLAMRGPFQAQPRDHVTGNVCAAFDGHLEATLHKTLSATVSLVCPQRDTLLVL